MGAYSSREDATTPSSHKLTLLKPEKRPEETEDHERRGSEGPSLDAEGEIRKTLATLFEPGSVVEMRVLNDKGWTRSGYFDDRDALSEEAAEYDRQGWRVYVTLNVVNSALLARAANRIVDRRQATTSDNDITRRRWLLVDVDPVRPSGVSSTDEEKAGAEAKMLEVGKFLRKQGWPYPVVADSGNGYHLLYPVELPNDRESLELVRGVLEALAFRFDDDRAKIDQSVCNAARIVRLYGTTTRKGDDTPERPHRRSKIKKIRKEA